jgi:beta-lactamase superfamily II metal-dependent hydrolase
MRALLAVVWLALSPWQPYGVPAARDEAAVQDPPFCRGPDSLGVRVTFFDVGQGAATLLETSDGRNVLVDGGRSPEHASNLLRARHVRTVDLMVATHNHADHIGGLPLLLTSMMVTNLLENGTPATTDVYASFVEAASGANVRVLEPSARRLDLGELELRVLPPASTSTDQNERSIGIVASFGAFRAVFSGDAGIASLRQWIDRHEVPKATVVLAGHHGSDDATSPAWVRATSPAVVVVSVGRGNSYGHPSPRSLAMWAAPERVILRTDLDGTIEMRGCRDGSFTLASTGARHR